MSALVGIISRCGLRIEVCHRNQPNKSRLAVPFSLSYLKQLYISNKLECFSYKSGYGLTCIEAFKRVRLGYRQMTSDY